MLKKMKFLIFIALCTISTFAAEATSTQDWNILESSFEESIGKARVSEFKNFASLPEYLEAKTYITDRSKYYKAQKTLGTDPHTPEGVKTITVLLPNWPKVFDAFYKSAIDEQNPISAFMGITILRSYLGKLNKGVMLDKRKALAKILFDSNICQGYIEYGDIFAYGIATKVDYKKAYEIYSQGQEICKSIPHTWYTTVLTMKMLRVKK